ncbi:RNA polymerase sigma factor [Maribacter sp. 2-571]|uniref:RNA polymerase sigma factor n=1 Tax=Maribacter sp. 2-571 TaxID=3417569 RepID=UPI003D328268
METDNAAITMTDEELVEQIVKDNNTMLFGLLYDRYAKRIYHKCSIFSKSDQEAEDLTQDVFLMLFVKLGGFKGRSKFSTWVYAFTYNFCVNHVNRNKERKISDKSDVLSEEVTKAAEVDDESLYSIPLDKLKIALTRIDPEDKKLLLLKYQDGIPIKELCNVLGIGESAVKMRLKRAKAKLIEVYHKIP